MLEITYRFKDDPRERPDQSEEIPASELTDIRERIQQAGGYITGQRTLHWSESLARMENNPDS